MTSRSGKVQRERPHVMPPRFRLLTRVVKMARCFVRIDLSDNSGDFVPLAVEPGFPLIDRSRANARRMAAWLGGMAAEPEWQGDRVGFYVCDDRGGRLERAVCQPIRDEDLKGPLENDLAVLKERLAKAQPKNATEKAVLRVAAKSLDDLLEGRQRTDRSCYLFRYRDAHDRWRLVWCWGYQRGDQQPATPMVCSNPDCALLSVRRPGQSSKCPACQIAPPALPKKQRQTKWKGIAAVLLLLILVGGLGYWYFTQNPAATESPTSVQMAEETTIAQDGEVVAPPASAEVSQEPVDPLAVEPAVAKPEIEPVQGGASSPATREETGVFAHEEITDLRVEPSQAELAVGDLRRVRILGLSAAGWQRLNPQPRLTIAIEGPNPSSIEMMDGKLVRGAAPGDAILRIQWDGKLSREVPITVTDVPANVSVMDDLNTKVAKGAFEGAVDVIPGGQTTQISSARTLRVWLEPAEVSVKVGEKTPDFRVMVQEDGSPPRRASSPPETADATILARDPEENGRFVGKSLGTTQVRATYAGREALAKVNVTGKRFLEIHTTLNEGNDDFSVTLEVLADAEEGALEYRAYIPDQSPTEEWGPAEKSGERLRAVLRSGSFAYGPPSASYRLMLEARPSAGGTVERYPFTFRLIPRIVPQGP